MWFPIFVQVKLLLRLVNETLNISDANLTLKKDKLNGNLESCHDQHTQRLVFSGYGGRMIPKI